METCYDEGLNEILIMDWLIGSEMPKPQSDAGSVDRSEVQRIVSGQLKSARSEIVSDVVAALKPRRGARLMNRPLVIGAGSALLSGLLILATSEFLTHRAKDLNTQIADEITRQLDQRANKDAENLNNRIAAEVGKQLEPIHQQLEGLSQDIGKIKDNLHIAQVKPTAPPIQPQQGGSPLQVFAGMDLKRFTASLPLLHKAVLQAAPLGALQDIVLLRSIADKLRHTSEDSPDYWPTLMQFIRFATAGSVAHPGKTTIRLSNNTIGG